MPMDDLRNQVLNLLFSEGHYWLQIYHYDCGGSQNYDTLMREKLHIETLLELNE